MNTTTIQAGLDAIKAMNFWDLDQRLATIPPLRSGADPKTKFHIGQHLTPNENVAEGFDYTAEQKQRWGTITGGDVVGYQALSYLISERLFPLIDACKKVVIIGEDEGFEDMVEGFGDVYSSFLTFKGSLDNQDDALALRDEIALGNVDAVVLLNQEGQLEHLNMIEAVPVYRGKQVVMTKRLPIFHVHGEQWVWNEEKGRMQFNTTFAVFDKQIEEHEDDRLGCTQAASTIKKEHREWLWPGYLGRNKIAHFGGASSEGKSPVTLDLAARVSAGLQWPDGTDNTLGPKSVILLAAEDDWSDTIIPRLELAGANLNNIFRFFVTQKTVELTPSLDSDCQRLERQIKQLGNVGLVVIDPITNYLGSKKMNIEEEIRGGILMPLSTVAKAHDCSIITVGHLNKRDKDTAVLQRLMGAAAFGGVARDVFIFGPDPDDEDKYAHTMSETRNKSAPQLKYRTEVVKVEWDGKTSEVVRVKWCGVSHADVDDVVNAPRQQEKSMTGRAVALITGMLRSGAKRKADIDQALKENGINPEQLKFDNIKKRCKAETRPLPGKAAGWEWFLPTKQEQFFDEQGATKQ
jgi:hypothetical protein